MKKLIVFLFALFIVAGSMAYAQPKLEMEGGNTYDWGKINQKDSPLKTSVKIFNKGTDTLHVTKVKPTCGCTTAPLDKNKIAPGEFATLNISLRVSSYSGHVGKTIRISSNDPDNSNLTYRLKANVFTPVDMSPKYLRMYNARTGNEETAHITLKNNTDNDITIKKIDNKMGGLELDLKEDTVIPAKGNLKISAKYTPEKEGPFYGKVNISTDSGEMPHINFTVRGRAKDVKSDNDDKGKKSEANEKVKKSKK